MTGGISSAEALKIGQMVKAKLPQVLQSRVQGVSAPYSHNTQITFQVTGGTESCWELRNKITEQLQAHPVAINDKNIYCSVQNSPWRTERNAVLSRARRALRRQCTPALFDSLDFRYNECSIYSSKGWESCCMGRLTKKGWRWWDAVVAQAIPGINMGKLRADSGQSDSE